MWFSSTWTYRPSLFSICKYLIHRDICSPDPLKPKASQPTFSVSAPDVNRTLCPDDHHHRTYCPPLATDQHLVIIDKDSFPDRTQEADLFLSMLLISSIRERQTERLQVLEPFQPAEMKRPRIDCRDARLVECLYLGDINAQHSTPLINTAQTLASNCVQKQKMASLVSRIFWLHFCNERKWRGVVHLYLQSMTWSNIWTTKP